jgi:ubiquinone/menaquinone biosynthesis C-methylase UbiE
MLDLFKRKLERPENADIRNVRLVAADACALPFPPDSFDVVYLVEALGEIPDQHKALGEAKRVLKPGGTLAVTEFFIDPHYPLRGTTVKKCVGAGFLPDAAAGSFWNYTLRFRKP